MGNCLKQQYCFRNQRRTQDALSSVQKMIVNSIKRVFPAGTNEVLNNTNAFSVQQQRRQQIKQVSFTYFLSRGN